MKMIYKITCLLSIGHIAMVSCSESFFDRYPDDQFTEGVFYKNEQDFSEAVTAIYSAQRAHYRRFYAIGDVSSDDAYNFKGNSNLNAITINESTVFSDNLYLKEFWDAGYRMISRSNMVVGRIRDVDIQQGRKDRFAGEARFLRALAYFNMVRVFGDIPLVTEEIKTASDAFAIGRSSAADVYSFIIQDLKEAVLQLPESYALDLDKGRTTSIAAKSLLGKVYLTQHQYADAATVLKEVISSQRARLLADYSAVFDANNPNNDEIIYAIQHMRNISGQGSGWGNDAAPNVPVGRTVVTGGGGGSFHMTRDLHRAFDRSDNRLLMVDSAAAVNGGRMYYWTKKYIDPQMLTVNNAANDWIVLRYADVLLMAAEALNESGGNPTEILGYLNQIRDRAGLSAVTVQSQSDLRSIIAHERRIELNCEGHRWFELLRTARLKEVMNIHFTIYRDDDHEVGQSSVIEDHELLFPLPKDQVDLNPDKLPQNPGY